MGTDLLSDFDGFNSQIGIGSNNVNLFNTNSLTPSMEKSPVFATGSQFFFHTFYFLSVVLNAPVYRTSVALIGLRDGMYYQIRRATFSRPSPFTQRPDRRAKQRRRRLARRGPEQD